MTASDIDAAQTSAAQASSTPPQLTLGPYSEELPAGLQVTLQLGSGRAGLLGWDAEVVSARTTTGYSHVGLEERIGAQPLEWGRVLEMVESLCGGCSQANTLALAQAAESMAQLIVPPRAAYLRLVLCELERAISHLMNAADTMEGLGLHGPEIALRDLRERALRALGEWSGQRFHPSLITYGGLARNFEENICRALALEVRHVERALRVQVNSIVKNKGVASRLAGLGEIAPEDAVLAGLRGPVARACGLAVDMRATFPTGAYEEEGATIVVQRAGDAFARLVVRLLESLESMRLVEQALDDLPPGPVKARGVTDMRGGSGISRIEGPRGEVFCWVRGGGQGITGLHLSTGSFPTLGVLPGLLRGIDMDDVRLLVLSLDLCMACAER